MSITEERVTNFENLHKAIEGRGYNLGWVYRGQADATWGLIPKIGRTAYLRLEEKMFLAWQRYAFEYVQNPKGLDNCDCPASWPRHEAFGLDN
jgi:hypothetical protein